MSNRDLHIMELPKKVIIGRNIIDKVTNIFPPLGKDIEYKVIITGPNVYNIIKDKIDEKLKQNSYIYIVRKATWNEVYRIKKEILTSCDKNFEYIIGLGGGKVIDISKMISFKLNKKFISIPTTPSHDGIASQFVSLKEKNKVYSYSTRPPTAIIVDLNILENAPGRLISSGVGDAIAKITAVEDWKLAHEKMEEYFGEYSANLALLGAELVKKRSEGIGRRDSESIRTLVEALISDGVAAGIAGSSRPCSGSEHLFSHAIDIFGNYHALHGEQVGVGTIIMSYLHDLDYEGIKDTLSKAGAPTNYKELGISKRDMINGLLYAKKVRPERYTILNEIKIDRIIAERILKKVKVIW